MIAIFQENTAFGVSGVTKVWSFAATIKLKFWNIKTQSKAIELKSQMHSMGSNWAHGKFECTIWQVKGREENKS